MDYNEYHIQLFVHPRTLLLQKDHLMNYIDLFLMKERFFI